MDHGLPLLAATAVALWQWFSWSPRPREVVTVQLADTACRCICQVERESLPLAVGSFHHAGLALAGLCILLRGCCCGARVAGLCHFLLVRIP